MSVWDRISLYHEGSFKLASRVILGTVDVAAVGARVLMSLDGPPGWTKHETPLHLQGLALAQMPTTTTTKALSAEGYVKNAANQPLRPVLAAATTMTASPGSTSSSSSEAASSPAVGTLLNFYPPTSGADGGAASPEVSLLIINTVMPEAVQAEVAVAILEVLERGGLAAAPAAEEPGGPGGPGPASSSAADGDGGPTGAGTRSGGDAGRERSISIVAAMLLQQLAHPAALYQYTINGAEPLDSTLPPLLQPAAAGSGRGGGGGRNAGIRVRDGFLSALLHVLEVSGTRACCLLAPGYKPPAATPLDLPDSLPACDSLGAALAAVYGLRYNAEKCRALHAVYKWFVTERSAGCDVMYV